VCRLDHIDSELNSLKEKLPECPAVPGNRVIES
jgi:hypothetical protein